MESRGKSPFSRPGKSWKIVKVMESHEESWKMIIMSCHVIFTEAAGAQERMNSCWTVEIFVNMCKLTSGFIFLVIVLRAARTVTTNSSMHS